VATWNVTAGSLLAVFDTVLDFGGRRLAIDSKGERCAAAAYTGKGLMCRGATDGTALWTRRDLKRLQFVAFSHDGLRLFCGSDARPCIVLDAATGEQVGALRGVRRLWESPFTGALLLDGAQLRILPQPNARPAGVDRTTFAILGAAFSPGALSISESGGPVRCVDLSGREIWRYTPDEGRHVLDLSYSESAAAFVGVEWPYQVGGNKTLLRFDTANGRAVAADIGEPAETAFCLSGTLLLTSDGAVRDTMNGTLVSRLAFGTTP
jgi:outer membrane protein assembly factor BamB